MCPENPKEPEYPPLAFRTIEKYKCPHGREGSINCPYCRMSEAIGILIGDSKTVRRYHEELMKENADLRENIAIMREELRLERERHGVK